MFDIQKKPCLFSPKTVKPEKTLKKPWKTELLLGNSVFEKIFSDLAQKMKFLNQTLI